ncbi:MAG: protein-L-isoaspartate O-methyltransferase, partial [Thermoanaerobaculia bacterium]|nr:protein-L-isoaspartate O-methyltransferase [Thermoanaerobaculia bacterium]
LVTAGAPGPPQPLLDQLAPRGRMVIPEGDRAEQRLVVYEKTPKGNIRRTEGEAVAFVPLVGRHGWTEEGSR